MKIFRRLALESAPGLPSFSDVQAVINQLNDEDKYMFFALGTDSHQDLSSTIVREILYDNHIPVAFAEAYDDSTDLIKKAMIGIVVAPSHRGKGLSIELINRVIDKLKEKGYQRLIYRVKLGNKASINLAKSYGLEYKYTNDTHHYYIKDL